jgi:hypothetical protein
MDSGQGVRHSRLRNVAVGLLGLVAAGVFLVSGVVLSVGLALTPNPGNEALFAVLKAADVIGWGAIGFWLLVDWGRLRLRVLGAAVAAWLWTVLLQGALNSLGSLNWGY